MQCRDAQFYLRLRRHAGDELGTEVTADLDRHLAGCPACAADAALAAGFDRAVATAVRSVPVPAGLRDKLLAQASTHHGAVIRRKVYRVAALAASLFFGVGLAFGVFSATRPKLDTQVMLASAEDVIQYPDKALAAWLAEHKFPAQLPESFNTDLLLTLGSERVQGVEVPVAVFRHPTDPRFAKLYFFRTDGRYDLKDLRNTDGSNTAAKVIDDQRQFRGVKYVLVYPAGPDGLKPFLRPPGQSARLDG